MSTFTRWKSFVSYLNDGDNRILQLTTYYLPTTWSRLDTLGGETVVFRGCNAADAAPT